mgnify:CR=1 FL=1
MAVTRTDKEFQPLDALARALEAGYCLKLDKRLRAHLEDWMRQWELCFLPEVDRPVDFVFNDDRREVTLVPGKENQFRLTAETRNSTQLHLYNEVATLNFCGHTVKLTHWDILDVDMGNAIREVILGMLIRDRGTDLATERAISVLTSGKMG